MSASGTSGDARRLLADSVAQYCRRSEPSARLRRHRGTAPGYERAAYGELGRLGWLGVMVPEAQGGSGLGAGELAVLARGLARHVAPEPFSAATMATVAIAASSDSAMQRQLLPELVEGACLAALAWQERAGVLDLGDVQVSAQAGPGALRLQGRKRFVMAGHGADGYVVSARQGGELLLVWVPAGTSGLACTDLPLADGGFAVDLRFDGASVPAANLLAAGECAQHALEAALEAALVAASAELLGLAERALELTLDYLRTRVQFGRPIGSFQALQHRAVDLYIHRRVAEATLAQAIRTLESTDAPVPRAAALSRAKARCTDAATRITREAIQMHGAIGFTDDCDVGLYVKRALVLSAWLGNAALHRRRYAELVPADAE